VSDPEAQADASAFFRKLVAGRTDALYVDVASALCKDLQCSLGENGTSFYLDRHHLTPYGAMRVQDRVQAIDRFRQGIDELVVRF
jgi:hypothetical protein